jgi:hypothetical protein
MAGGTTAVVLLSCNDLEVGFDEDADMYGDIFSTKNLYLHDVALAGPEFLRKHKVI